MEFCHLHVHSEKSWFDSIIRIPYLVQKAVSFQMSAIGITDHHHVMGWMELERCSRERGIQPVFGMEMNVETYHLTALAMNDKGIENLLILNNLGRARGKVFVTQAELLAYKDGLFFLSGCSKGMLHAAYYRNGVVAMAEMIETCLNWFPSCFAIEISTPHLPTEMLNGLLSIADKRGIMLVPTNDCHFIAKEDESVYAQNLWLRTRGKIMANKADKYFKSTEEMMGNHRVEWLRNTMIVADKCKTSYRNYLSQSEASKKETVFPLSFIERFSDEESMRIVYESRKDYKKAHRVSNLMRRTSLTLEDLLKTEEYHEDVDLAFGIRNTIKRIRADNRYCVSTKSHPLPLFKNRKADKPFLQWTLEDAIEMGASIVEMKKRTTS